MSVAPSHLLSMTMTASMPSSDDVSRRGGAGGLSGAGGFRFRVVADAVADAVAAVAFAAVAAFVVVVNARRSDLGDRLRDGPGAVLGK